MAKRDMRKQKIGSTAKLAPRQSAVDPLHRKVVLQQEDLEDIIYEGTHIPDRDQMMGRDKKNFPPESARYYSGEEYNYRPFLPDDDDRPEPVDQALRHMDRMMLHDDLPSSELEDPFMAAPAGRGDSYVEMSDEELQGHARALSIPGSDQMRREQVLEALRSTLQGNTH